MSLQGQSGLLSDNTLKTGFPFKDRISFQLNAFSLVKAYFHLSPSVAEGDRAWVFFIIIEVVLPKRLPISSTGVDGNHSFMVKT